MQLRITALNNWSMNMLNYFTGLGKLKDYKVRLHIDDTIQPDAQMHRHIPLHIRKDLEAQLKADEDLVVIQQPTGPTPWVSPVVCVPKKNGKMRVCVDMRSANIAIKRECHSTPTINGLMNDLNGATVFSKLDLNQGYNQLELEESSRFITTFCHTCRTEAVHKTQLWNMQRR